MSIQNIVREAEQNYIQGTSKLGKYVDWSMYDTVETIDAYSLSRHTSSPTDALGREKPFFNIVTSAVNIWYRATDLDRKNIRIMPDSITSVPLAFMGTVLLQRWMDKNRFGVFLNQWGRTLAKYGSAVVKFVEINGNLEPSVIPWNRFIADPIDFDAIPHIEKFYVTESQLKKLARERGYDMKKVEEFCTAETTRKTLEGFNQDNEGEFIEIYEVHGELSMEDYKEAKGEKVLDGDEENFFQQMHVVCFTKVNGEYKDFTLYCGREKKDPYMITHLIKEDGRTLSIGAVEYLFDAQWMQNHSIKQWKDQVDLASKLIFQTADKNFVGRNVLSAIQNGDIMVHDDNKPLTVINNQGHDITSIQGFMSQWRILNQEITSTPDAIRGNSQPSGTAYRSVAIQQAEANSLFEVMTENKGLAVEDMLRMFVLPHLKTKLNTDEEVMAILDDNMITEIDSIYIPNEAVRRFNERTIDTMLSGGIPSPFQKDVEEMQVRNDMKSLGNKRSFSPDEVSWKKALSDLKWENVKVEITNESKDKQAVLTSLTGIFQDIASNPGILQNPDAKMVFSKIMNETGTVSPMELSNVGTASPPQNGGEKVGAGVGELATQ